MNESFKAGNKYRVLKDEYIRFFNTDDVVIAIEIGDCALCVHEDKYVGNGVEKYKSNELSPLCNSNVEPVE